LIKFRNCIDTYGIQGDQNAAHTIYKKNIDALQEQLETYHKKKFSTHTSDHVLHQHLLLEEYGAVIEYIQGEKNIVANTFYYLPTQKLFLFKEENTCPLNLNLLAKAKKEQ
jgi:hypothetical protein